MEIDSILSDIKKELNCCICSSLFNDPVTLSCQHSFCCTCIKKLNQIQKNNKVFPCPLCRETVNRRAFYINEKYERILKFIAMCEKLKPSIASKKYVKNNNGNDEKNERFDKYLIDCFKELNRNKELTDLYNKTERLNNSTDLFEKLLKSRKRSTSKANVSLSKSIVLNPSEENTSKLKKDNTKKSLSTCIDSDQVVSISSDKNKRKKLIKPDKILISENTSSSAVKRRNTRKSKVISAETNDSDNAVTIVCATPEQNEIVKTIEEEFLNELQNEFSTVNNETTVVSTSGNKTKNNVAKSPFNRLKTISKEIKKREPKYKRLKTEVISKSKTDDAKKIKSSVEQNTIDLFPDVRENILDVIGYLKDDDDIFLQTTQIAHYDNVNVSKAASKSKSFSAFDELKKEPMVSNESNCNKQNIIKSSTSIIISDDEDIVTASENENKSVIKQLSVDNNVWEDFRILCQENTKLLKICENDKLIDFNDLYKTIGNVFVLILQVYKKYPLNNDFKNVMRQNFEQNLQHCVGYTFKDLQKFVNTLDTTTLYCNVETQTNTEFNNCISIGIQTDTNELNPSVCAAVQTDVKKIKSNGVQTSIKCQNISVQTDNNKKCSNSIQVKSDFISSNVSKKETYENYSDETFNELNDLLNNFKNNTKKPKQTTPVSKAKKCLNYEDKKSLLIDSDKKRYKRIRTPSDSDDSDSSSVSSTVKKHKENTVNDSKSKYLYRNDIDVIFHSDVSELDQNKCPNVTTKNNTVLDKLPDDANVSVSINTADKRSAVTVDQMKKSNVENNKNINDSCSGGLLFSESEKTRTPITKKNIIESCSPSVSLFPESDDKENHNDNIILNSLLTESEKVSNVESNKTKLDDNIVMSASLFAASDNKTVIHHDNMSASLFVDSNQTVNKIESKSTNIDNNTIVISLGKQQHSTESANSNDIILNTESSSYNSALDIMNDDELDKEVELLNNSVGSNEDLFEEDIVENTPAKELTRRSIPTNINSLTPDVFPFNQIDMNRSTINMDTFKPKSASTQLFDMPPPPLPQPNNNQLSTGNEITNRPSSSLNKLHTVMPSKSLNPILIQQCENNSPLDVVKSQNTCCTTPISSASCSIQQQQAVQTSILHYMTPRRSTSVASTSKTPIECRAPGRSASPVLSNRLSTNRKSRTPSVHYVLCTSRIRPEQLNVIMTYAPSLGAKFLKTFNENVTHLIVDVDQWNKISGHTSKYLLAVAHGKWIVNYKWFESSLKEKYFINEEPYEVLDITNNPGPKKSRLLRHVNPVLKNFVIYLQEPFYDVEKSDFEDMILSCGGELLHSLENFKRIPGKHYLLLAESPTEESKQELLENLFGIQYRLLIVVADIQWLQETIGQCKLASIIPHLFYNEDDLKSLGFPTALLQYESDS